MPEPELVYMPSMVLTGNSLPEGWTITKNASDWGYPTVADGVIHFDYTLVPYNSQTGVGYVMGGGATSNAPDSEMYHYWVYNIARPELGGHVAFTVTVTDVGVREQVRLSWSIGSLVCEIAQGRDLNQQIFNTGPGGAFPWTGSCSYELWFPNGVNFPNGPARLDFSGGGSIWMPNGWFNRDDYANPMFESGRVTTFSPPGPFPFPPRDPKTAHAYISGLSIEAWDPTTEVLPFTYPWAIAKPDGTWYGTDNYTASSYYDEDLGETVYDWAYMHRAVILE